MAVFKKIGKTIKKTLVSEKKNEDAQPDIKKLSVFVTIVNRGQSGFVLKLFESEGANAQFVQHGEGTAKEEIREILGIDDNTKEIIFSIIKNEKIESAKKELQAFFKVSKRNRGIGFSIPMTSIIGMKVYQFLTDTN